MAKKVVVIYEGAMCCSTGICGPEPDKELIEFNQTLKRLQKEFEDYEIIRASLSFNVDMFIENKEIFQLVKENGSGVLPITTVNGRIIAKRRYLRYDEFKEVMAGASKD